MEAEVDRLLAWEDETEQVSMTDIEDQVLAVRQRLSAHLTEVLAQQRAQKADVQVPNTSDGWRLHYKGKKQNLPNPHGGLGGIRGRITTMRRKAVDAVRRMKRWG